MSAPDARCLISATKAILRGTVDHGTGSYPTHDAWSLERTGSEVWFARNQVPQALSLGDARRLIEEVVGIVSDRTKDPGNYRTVIASVHWTCDSAPEGHARFTAVEYRGDDAPPSNHVARIERAFVRVSAAPP